MDPPQEYSSFQRRWLTHWLTCIAVSCLFLLLLWPFEHTSLFESIDRFGADAVIKLYEPAPDSPRVVVVDVGIEPGVADVADALQKLQSFNFLALGIDFIAATTLERKPLFALTDELKQLSLAGRPIAMAITNAELVKQLEGLENIRQASADLTKDGDGVVRNLEKYQCTKIDGVTVTVPTLAWAVVAPDRQATTLGCVESGANLPILFPPILPVPQPTEHHGILLLTKDMIDSNHEVFDDAYVIVGAVASGIMHERFATPLGELPGAVIHADAVWTLAVASKRGSTFVTGSSLRGLLGTGLNLLTGIVAGAVFAVFLACTRRKGQTRSAWTEILRFTYGIAGLLMMGVVLLVLGIGWIWVASSLVTSGIVLGAGAVMFGAMLETLAHVGADLVEPIHWALDRILQRVLLPTAVLLPCVLANSALATDCAYRLSYKGQVPEPVFHHGDRWLPFERLAIPGAGTTITMTPVPGSNGDQLNFTRPGVWILPPCPPQKGVGSAWRSFWASLNPRDASHSTGATMLQRGATDESQSGPLRELSTLVAATGPMIGNRGLALVWAGGHPPYAVELQDEATGSAIGHATTEHQYLWLPLWSASDRPVRIGVRDNDGKELRRVLRPLPPLSDIPSGLDGAIELFQTRPAYRMEAMRQLFELSDAGVDVADRAIELIRATGAAQ